MALKIRQGCEELWGEYALRTLMATSVLSDMYYATVSAVLCCVGTSFVVRGLRPVFWCVLCHGKCNVNYTE